MLITFSSFAQQKNWQYVTTITEGVKFYLGSDHQATADGHPLVWEKILTPDGSWFVSLIEWDCRLKNRRPMQTTAYNADNTIRGTRRQPVWEPVIPDTSGELMFERVCLPPPEAAFAEITVSKAGLFAAPDASAAIPRFARRGERFLLLTNTGIGGWFNIVDPQTAQDYWLTDDNFRISGRLPTAGQKTSTAAVPSAAPRGSAAKAAPRAKTATPVKTKNRRRP